MIHAVAITGNCDLYAAARESRAIIFKAPAANAIDPHVGAELCRV